MKRTFLLTLFFGLVYFAVTPPNFSWAVQIGHWNNVMGTDPSKEHEYSFSVDQDGAVNVRLSGESTMESQYAQVTLKDANGEKVDWFYLTNLPAQKTFYLAPGTWILVVGKYRGDIYGRYDLSVDFQAAGANISEAENNDHISRATPVTENIIYGSLGHMREKNDFDNADYFSFSLPVAGDVSFHISVDSTLSSQYNGLKILDSNGEVKKEISFLSSSRDISLHLDAGTFYLVVFTGRNSYHGAYEISLETAHSGTEAISIKMIPQEAPRCEVVSIDSSRSVDMDVTLDLASSPSGKMLNVYFIIKLGDSILSVDESGAIVSGMVPVKSNYVPAVSLLSVFSSQGIDFSGLKDLPLTIYSGYIFTNQAGESVVKYDCRDLQVE